ncbi:2959_t:CDS:2, partial [Cetraspora pellucida]
LNHNHTISPRANLYAPKYRTFLDVIVQEVRFYIVKGNLNATKYKRMDHNENDAVKLLKYLLTKKAEEPE